MSNQVYSNSDLKFLPMWGENNYLTDAVGNIVTNVPANVSLTLTANAALPDLVELGIGYILIKLAGSYSISWNISCNSPAAPNLACEWETSIIVTRPGSYTNNKIVSKKYVSATGNRDPQIDNCSVTAFFQSGDVVNFAVVNKDTLPLTLGQGSLILTKVT